MIASTQQATHHGVALALMFACGCTPAGHRASTSRAPSTVPADAATATIHVRGLRSGAGCPALQTWLDGQSLWMCLDTGSPNTMVLDRLEKPGVLDVGFPIPNLSAMKLESNWLTNSGLGGLLAPQALATANHHIALNLNLNWIAQVPDALIERESLGDQVLALSESNVRRCDLPGTMSAPKFIVDVSIAGRTTPLLIDTGSESTLLRSDSPTAARLTKRYGSAPAGEYQRTDRRTRIERLEQPVRFPLGGFTVTSRLLIEHDAPRSQCNLEGALGRDVLRHCLIVLNRYDLRAVCVVPQAE